LLDIYILSVFAIIAASFSSFFIASDYRGWKNLNKPSSCDNCGEKIDCISLIPIIGALISNFKCKKCNKKFSNRMAIMEFCSVLLFLGLHKMYISVGGETDTINFEYLSTLFLLAVTSGLFSLFSFEDWKNHTISDIYILSAFLLLLVPFYHNISVFAYILAGSYLFKMFADSIVTYIKKEDTVALGEGDIMLFALVGLIVPFTDISIIFLIMSISAIIMTKRSDNPEQIAPLAPNMLFALSIYSVCLYI